MARPGDLEAVRRAFEAINREDLERVLELTHPDFEVEVPPEFSAEPDTYRGREGMRRYWESFREAMSDIRFRAERMWEGADGVVVAMKMSAKGRHTEIAVEQRMTAVWTVSDGMVRRVRVFAQPAQAFAEAGLGEPPDAGADR